LQLGDNPSQAQIDAGELDSAANTAGQEFGGSLRSSSDTKLNSKAVDTVSRVAGEKYVQENVNANFVDKKVVTLGSRIPKEK
jgi:hypothetical protein